MQKVFPNNHVSTVVLMVIRASIWKQTVNDNYSHIFHHFGVNTEWNLKHDKIGEKSAQGWLPMVLGLREDLLKEYDETMKEHK